MAFEVITVEEIATGQPVSNETAGKIKNNLDSLNQRLSSAEGGGNTVYPPLIFRVNGTYGESGDLAIPAVGILKTTLNFNITVTGVRILVDKAGVSGTTEVDLKFKRGSNAYTSILQTKPSVAYDKGDDATSTNGQVNPDQVNLLAGDILRLDITDAQKRAAGMLIRVDYIKT